MNSNHIAALAALAACCPVSVVAQNVTMTAEAPSEVEAGEQFRVRYTVNTQDANNFTAPDFRGFEVIYGPATSRQSSIQIINGRTSQSASVTFTYVLLASKPGSYTINPASVQCGKTIRSRALKVRVVNPGTSRQQSGGNPYRQQVKEPTSASGISSRDLFMTATASRTRVHEQEAVQLTYKLYTLVNLTQLDGKLPTLNGFQIQEVPLPRTKEFKLETYKGRNYHTTVWAQYVVFPQKAGQLTVPAITYEGVVVSPNRNIDPIDAFFNGTSGMLELKKKIVAPSITIDVSPLPAKPAGYSGAVGQFGISAGLTPERVKANDALTLKLIVKGTGNLKLIGTPEVKFPKDFETYDAKVNDNFKLTKAGLAGSKTFEYLAVPRHPGTYTVPPVEFCYFDVTTQSYRTLKTQAFTVHVDKAQGGQAVASDYGNGQEDVAQLNQDIRFIKQGTPASHAIDPQFVSSYRYLLCYLVPMLLFAVSFAALRKRRAANEDVVGLKVRKANKVARKRLKAAERMLNDKNQNAFYDETLKALYGYAADKFNLEQEHLCKDNIRQRLLEKQCPEQIVQEFLGTIDDCEFARYAPGDPSASMDSIFEKAVSLICKIENK